MVRISPTFMELLIAMDHKIVSRKGGMTTKEKYGREHYSAMGKRGAEAKLKMYGPGYFLKLSALGVAARRVKANLTP